MIGLMYIVSHCKSSVNGLLVSEQVHHVMLHPLQALFGHLTLDVIILTVLYSLAGLGIAIVNDFKSIEGDR